MYFHQLHGLRYGKTGCVEELCFHSSKTVLLLNCAQFREASFFWESTEIGHHQQEVKDSHTAQVGSSLLSSQV